MKLSIIIVNYNVRDFLQQCLFSVEKACLEMNRVFGNNSCEVFIIDNHSSDNSSEMLKKNFPQYHLIENKENVGFSKANNQALQLAKGEYHLLLNPDTLVGEHTLVKTVLFMDEHPDAGGLGVKMTDGNGHFLPESKRALPTPEVSFYKIFGLSALFPKSEKFGRYRLTYLDKNENHEVEILSGAFMLLRKTAIEKAGLLDETFFMYGEDIDLSYRLLQAGYKNYYFSETQIIHYKGESTKKGSLNYVYVFYNAMLIFAKKHFYTRKISLFSIMIYFAIVMRAVISVLGRIFSYLLFPLVDIVLFIVGFLLIFPFLNKTHFDVKDDVLTISTFLYILFWLLSTTVSKGYFKRISTTAFVTSVSFGILTMTAARIFFGKLIIFEYNEIFLVLPIVIIGSYLFRKLLSNFENNKMGFNKIKPLRILIAGGKEETNRIIKIYTDLKIQHEYLGRISDENNENSFEYLGKISDVEDIIKNTKANHLVFSLTDILIENIILTHEKLEKLNIKLSIYFSNSDKII